METGDVHDVAWRGPFLFSQNMGLRVEANDHPTSKEYFPYKAVVTRKRSALLARTIFRGRRSTYDRTVKFLSESDAQVIENMSLSPTTNRRIRRVEHRARLAALLNLLAAVSMALALPYDTNNHSGVAKEGESRLEGVASCDILDGEQLFPLARKDAAEYAPEEICWDGKHHNSIVEDDPEPMPLPDLPEEASGLDIHRY